MAGSIVSLRVKHANGGSIRCHICVPITHTQQQLHGKVPFLTHLTRTHTGNETTAEQNSIASQDNAPESNGEHGVLESLHEGQRVQGVNQLENRLHVKNQDDEPEQGIPEPLFTIAAIPREQQSDGKKLEEDWMFSLTESTGNCHIYSSTFISDISHAFEHPVCDMIENTVTNTGYRTLTEAITDEPVWCADMLKEQNGCEAHLTNESSTARKPDSLNVDIIHTCHDTQSEGGNTIVNQDRTSVIAASESCDKSPNYHQSAQSRSETDHTATKTVNNHQDNPAGRSPLNSSEGTESCCSLDNLEICNNEESAEASPLKVTLVFREHVPKDSIRPLVFDQQRNDSRNTDVNKHGSINPTCDSGEERSSNALRAMLRHNCLKATDTNVNTHFYTREAKDCHAEGKLKQNVTSVTRKTVLQNDIKRDTQQNQPNIFGDNHYASKSTEVTENSHMFQIVNSLKQKTSKYIQQQSENKENSSLIQHRRAAKRTRKGIPRKRKYGTETDTHVENESSLGHNTKNPSLVHKSPGLTITQVYPPCSRILQPPMEDLTRTRRRRSKGAKRRRFPLVDYSENNDENKPKHTGTTASNPADKQHDVVTYKFVPKPATAPIKEETRLSLKELLSQPQSPTSFRHLPEITDDVSESPSRSAKDSRSKNKSTKHTGLKPVSKQSQIEGHKEQHPNASKILQTLLNEDIIRISKIDMTANLAFKEHGQTDLLARANSIYATADYTIAVLEQQPHLNKTSRDLCRDLKGVTLFSHMFSETIRKKGEKNIDLSTRDCIEKLLDKGRLPETLEPVYRYAVTLCDSYKSHCEMRKYMLKKEQKRDIINKLKGFE